MDAAFGHRCIPQLNERMQHEDVEVRRLALSVLGDRVHGVEDAYVAIQKGCVETLCKLLKDDDAYIRYKSADIFVTIAQHSVGRRAMIDRKVIPALAALMDDGTDAVRFAVHHAFSSLAEIESGAEALVDEMLCPCFINKLKMERIEIRHLIMISMHLCTRIAPEHCIKNGLMPVLLDLLFDSNQKIRERAAQLVHDATICLEGKEQAIQLDQLVPRLIGLLDEDEEVNVWTAALSALLNITITTPGKYTCINCGLLPKVLELYRSTYTDVSLYSTKIITNLAEAPEGRSYIQSKGFASDWNKNVLDPKIATSDPLPNKRAKYYAKKVTYKTV